MKNRFDQKKDVIIFTLPEVINFMVNYTTLLEPHIGSNNVKENISMIFDYLKEEYTDVRIDP